MEFDIGNILYVVITLVAILVGLLGKKKKKPEGQGNGEPGEQAQPGFMENLEQMLRMGQENPQPVDLLEQEEDLLPEESMPVSEQFSEYKAEPLISGGSVLDDYDKIMGGFSEVDPDFMLTDGDDLGEALKVIDLDQEEGTDYFEIVKDFDAGTAVVYAAIINRLDY
jgi:hypothetical protein